jgi:hypothetical protein
VARERIKSNDGVRVVTVFAFPLAVGLGISLFLQPLVIDVRSAETARATEILVNESASPPANFERVIPRIEHRFRFKFDPETEIDPETRALLSELSESKPSAPGLEAPLQPIPEPSTGLLFGAGLIGIGLQRRRDRIGR